MKNPVELRIDRLAFGGEGVGRLEDGRVVFIPYVIPGEVVRAKVVEEKAHHARAELVGVLDASPERIEPRCKHFGTCGGCHYQQMSYERQLEAKEEILADQLRRIGGLKEIPGIESLPASEAWNYRNHLQFHLTREGKLGFQKAQANQPFAIQECHLPEAGINQLWPQIEIEPLPKLERVNLRQGVDGERMIILESASPEPLEFSIEGLDVSVVQVDPLGSVVLAGSNRIVMEVLARQFKVSASSFFQVNSMQAQEMVKLLLQELNLNENATLLDIYSGVGLFSAFMAPRVKRLVGIEISTEACEDFSDNLDKFDNVELYEASAEAVLNSIKFHPDVVIMDPPRAGLGAKTVEGLLAQGAETLAYVSCDPATLARDGKQISAGGYALEKIALIDMFPQTYHIESISFWKKR